MPLRKVAQEGYFFDKRGKIVDIMQVVSKDLENMSEIEKEIEFLKLWKFNKMNGAESQMGFFKFPMQYETTAGVFSAADRKM